MIIILQMVSIAVRFPLFQAIAFPNKEVPIGRIDGHFLRPTSGYGYVNLGPGMRTPVTTNRVIQCPEGKP